MRDVEAELAAIHERLAELASQPVHAGVASEIGAIRAQLQELARSNPEIAARLGYMLGLPGDGS